MKRLGQLRSREEGRGLQPAPVTVWTVGYYVCVNSQWPRKQSAEVGGDKLQKIIG